MSNQFTETTRKGWFSRLGSSLAGVLVGIAMIFAGMAGLAWNENRAVRTERALNEGSGVVVSVASDSIDPARERTLVHVSGDTSTQTPLTDPQFGVSAQGLRLVRDVEMFQWRETTERETRAKLGGGEETVTTYNYERIWSDSRQDSSSFRRPQGHENPAFRYEATSVTAQDARLGAFDIDEDIIERVGGAQALTLDDQSQAAARAALGYGATVSATTLYIGRNPNAPEVGDMRISYQLVPADTISVVAAQAGSGFATYQARNGEQVLLVSSGTQSAEQMFTAAQNTNRFILWAVRVAGIVGLIVGFGLIFNPLKVFADVIPFVGGLVGMGTGLVAAVLGFTIGFITIAVAWFAVRPLLSVGILAVGGLIVFGLWRLGRGRLKRSRAAAAAATAPADPPAPA